MFKATMKTREQGQQYVTAFSSVSIIDFEQFNVWFSGCAMIRTTKNGHH